MRLFIFKSAINFMKLKIPALVFSTILVLGSLLSLFTQGLNLGLDFTGGTVIEVKFEQAAELSKVRGALAANGFADAQVAYFGTSQDVMIRIAPRADLDQKAIGEKILTTINTVAATPVTVRKVDVVGSSVGDELKEDGFLAVLAALVGILIYVAARFEWRLSVGAVASLLHDVIITLGLFSIFQLEFDLTVLAAILALIGYSINDTIVVFDRIREMFRKLREATVDETVNEAITSTLSRTTMTSFTTALTLIVLFYMGGPMIHGFATALLFGIFIGTYSSVYIASALAVILGASREDLLPTVIEKEGEGTPSL
ncbi:MAG: protein translocase subunit SecF [Gammaproteobacteria bacterium]|jgi:preprotein translocase subunit SecF|nr:protein translocase subunit SecF [Gammaproteobacteria bacterium]MBU2180667.1 protein translocase subunit SecF [Gammaproteobacteria bacterium]MBU2224278.1 protein translocase subunit SecF [Gammaproteobacteria bacterium]MBU2280534.1 protein translocase subunit SecF [Gammaproteobacteria bacterium]MBU2427492.1 protein translocase subunit SecF [Gammaproteobacteria bacterium]